jgi:hypothetical protein
LPQQIQEDEPVTREASVGGAIDKNSDEIPYDEQIEEDEQPDLNEELYDKLMTSINELWADFDIDNGVIDLGEFKQVMIEVARD